MPSENLDTVNHKSRKEYHQKYYQDNKPTRHERFLMREAYREQRKLWNSNSRDILKFKKRSFVGPLPEKKEKRINKSGFKGVFFVAHMNKYRARIMIGGIQQTLGFFKTPEEAHKAYCIAVENKQQLGQ